ncbi:MAG: hypothetical protein AAF621_05530, partial [Pseudomonadota bacterium]
LLSACTDSIELFTSVEEYEANNMLVILLREGIAAERELNPDGTYKIVLDDKRYVPEAMNALKMRGYPQKKHENLCTTFTGEGMVSTPLEQKARYNCAKAQELSGALMDVDGIVKAHVVLELAETDPISRKVKPATASVLLKYKPGIDIDTLIPKVKELVTYGVANMVYTNVNVVAVIEKSRADEMIYKKPTEEELAMTTPNLIIGSKDPFERGTSNFFLYIFMAVLAAVMVAFIVFILRMRKNKLLSEDEDLQNAVTLRQDTQLQPAQGQNVSAEF